MDTLFENQYKETKALIREIYSYLHLRTPLFFVLNICIGSLFIDGLLPFIFPETFSHGASSSFAFFFPLLMWIYIPIRHFKGINTQYNRGIEMNNGEPLDMKLIVTDDGIDVFHTKRELKVHFAYYSVRKVVKAKNCVILVTKGKQYFVFVNDGFTKGNRDEFLHFLRSKGLKCRRASKQNQ